VVQVSKIDKRPVVSIDSGESIGYR